MRPPIPSFMLSRRVKIALAVVGTVIVLLVLASSLVGVYINWLWYGEVGYRGVYRSMIETRAVLLLIFGLLMALIIGANLVVAYLLRPPFRPLSAEQQNLERYRVLIEPRRRLILAIVMIIAFLTAGLAAQSNWRTWLLWRFGGSFGVPDPQFHRDVSFFAWDYPVYRLLLGFGFTAVIFSLVLSIAVYYLFGAIRLQTPGPKITLSARRHVTVLVFVFIVLKAIAYWLDRYGLVFSERGKVTGASYTDVNASLPAKTILFWIAVIIAAGVLASMWLHSAQLPAIGFGVLLVISILINGIYPAVVQQFTVKPNASDKEAPYIARNITATRQAYDVQNVTLEPYPVTTSPVYTALTQPSPTVANIRILDPNVVSPTFTQQQQLRNVYGFPAKLDVDRYTIDGVTRDYVVGVRELNAANLQGTQTNWINQRTVYTHGYGFAAAQANQDVTATGAYTEGDIPPQGPLAQNRPQVYYGELMPDYSIVGAQGSPREFDGNGAQKITYQGKGGIKLSNIFTRLAFAVKYKETNFLLNDAVSAKAAKIMFIRDPRERVQKVAPFLQIDGDPYPVVVNGSIQWIVDGYTTLSKFPYSELNSLADLTANTLSTSNRTASQPNSQINYIRNSVKATVDAYDGTVTLYQWDDKDPVLKAWMKVFPGLVQPKLAMPAGILQHVRYPEDLFEVQRSVLQQYHLLPTDAVKFYNASDKWTVPDDPNSDTTVNQPPYYVLANSPDNKNTEFQLTTPMKVNNRQNLAAFITVSCDQNSGSYGKITVLQLPTSSVIQGPKQIANSFKTTAVISKDISLLDQGGSNVIHGNLLTLPIGDSFLYVEPLYVSGSSSSGFPVLRRVLVAYGDKIGYSDSLSGALQNLAPGQTTGQDLGSAGTGPAPPSSPPSSSPPSTASSTPPKTTPTPTGTASVEAILAQLDAAGQRLLDAYKTGDPVKVGQAEAEVKRLTAEYLAARKATSSSPKPTPTSS
jgi:uncharacterized protein